MTTAVVSATEQAVVDALEHANRDGWQTSEFWAPIVAPGASFVVTAVAGWVVAHDIAAPSLVADVAPVVAGAVVSAASSFAARAYVAGRAALKAELVRLHVLQGGGQK